MTSSSSPGISLKSEGLSYIAACDLPALVVNVQRGGPGLGGIQPSQSDYFQAVKGGSHGDMRKIVLAPASVQEMASLTVKGFDLADKYRMIAMILADGTMGQMMEPVVLPEVAPRRLRPAVGLPPARKCKRTHNIINSLYLKPEQLEQKNFERFEKYRQVEAELRQCMNPIVWRTPTLCIVAFGITARVAKNAIAAARAQGIKVGLIRPITLWPFPKAPLCEAAEHCDAFLSVEMNMGQMLEDVQLAIELQPSGLPVQPGRRHDPRPGAGAGREFARLQRWEAQKHEHCI